MKSSAEPKLLVHHIVDVRTLRSPTTCIAVQDEGTSSTIIVFIMISSSKIISTEGHHNLVCSLSSHQFELSGLPIIKRSSKFCHEGARACSERHSLEGDPSR